MDSISRHRLGVTLAATQPGPRPAYSHEIIEYYTDREEISRARSSLDVDATLPTLAIGPARAGHARPSPRNSRKFPRPRHRCLRPFPKCACVAARSGGSERALGLATALSLCRLGAAPTERQLHRPACHQCITASTRAVRPLR